MTKILVIEDESPLRQLVVETLKMSGFEADGAGDGLAGLEQMQAQTPDLVLCDIGMPEMDGYQVLREIRSNPRTQTLPVIILTAMGRREDVRRGMEMGADDYLVKPFEVGELVATVKTQLRKQSAAAEKLETSLRLVRHSIVYALPHELRTPLFGISGFANLLKMDYQTIEPPFILEYAENILKAGARLERLIENFLVYAQIELIGGDEEQLKAMHNHLLRNPDEVIASSAQRIAAHWNRWDDLRLQPGGLALRISNENLQKIVSEIVDNAFKFSQPGSPVEVSTCVNGSIFTLSVSDQGRGMTAEQIERIGAFMQFDRVLHEQQGMGLGLAIAQKLVAFHEGKFELWSQVNAGTVVSVHFRCR